MDINKLALKSLCRSTFCKRVLLSNHVKHKPCQNGIVTGDVTMYNLNFALEARCVKNLNKNLNQMLIVSVNNRLNTSALLVKRTQTIAQIGIQYCDFRFQERNLWLFFVVYVTICNTLFNLYCIKVTRLQWLTHITLLYQVELMT